MQEQEQQKSSLQAAKSRLSPKRWLVLALYMLVFCVHTAIVVMFSPLAVLFEKLYDAGPMIFNINSLLMVFIYFPSNFLIANFLFEHLGVHLALTIGCVLDCLCLWVRVLINQNFYLAMVGGLFCGIAQPLIMNANAEFATNWFDTSERAMAIMLPALMGTVGGGLGYTYALFFVSSSDADNPNKDVGREHVFNMCMFAAVSVTVIFSISMAIIRSRPAIPPTESAKPVPKEPIGTSLMKLMKNRNFLAVMHAFALTYSCVTTFGQEVAFLTTPFGFTTSDNATMGAIFVMGGMLGAVTIGLVVSKTKRYQMCLLIVCTGTTLAACGLMGTLEVSSRLLTTVLVALLGFFILAIVAVGLDYGCEVSYPVPAHNSTGVMNAYSHIWCTIQLVAASLILSKTGEKSQSVANRMRAAAVSLVIIVVALGGLIGAVCSREDLRKHRLDAQAKASALIEGTSAA